MSASNLNEFTQPLEPKTDALIASFMKRLASNSLGEQVAYTSALHKTRLDYSADSLTRLEQLLVQLTAKTSPSVESFRADKTKTNFFSVLTFYLGDYLARLTGEEIHWYQGKYYFKDDAIASNAYHNRFVCEINGQLIKPAGFIASKLFAVQSASIATFISESLDTITNPTANVKQTTQTMSHVLQPRVGDSNNHNNDIGSDGSILFASDADESLKPTDALSSDANLANKTTEAFSTTQTESNALHESVSDTTHDSSASNTAFGSLQTQPKKIRESAHKTQTNLKQVSSNLSENFANDESYEAKFNINYNSNIIERFRPPIAKTLMYTVPLGLLLLYNSYGLVVDFQKSNDLSTFGLVFTGLLFCAFVGLWVLYFLTSINVFDNKVTITSPLKNQTTRFDKRVRFFHVQGDGKFMGQKEHVVVKSNTEVIRLEAQNHEAMTDLLMEVEASLIVPSLLARLQNGETVTFAMIKLNDHVIQYGNIETKLENIADYEIEDNFLYLYKKDGEQFARIGISSEPNINSFLTILNELIEVDKDDDSLVEA